MNLLDFLLGQEEMDPNSVVREGENIPYGEDEGAYMTGDKSGVMDMLRGMEEAGMPIDDMFNMDQTMEDESTQYVMPWMSHDTLMGYITRISPPSPSVAENNQYHNELIAPSLMMNSAGYDNDHYAPQRERLIENDARIRMSQRRGVQTGQQRFMWY